jgi:hypothetical protein
MRSATAQWVLIGDVVPKLAEVGDGRVVVSGQAVRGVGVFKVGDAVELVVPSGTVSSALQPLTMYPISARRVRADI